MTALTAVQIAAGIKRNITPIGPKPPEPAGRWICHECPWPTWHAGRYQDWMDHYLEHHQKED